MLVEFASELIPVFKKSSFFLGRLLRGNQVYNFPIHLCEDVLPSPIFYGTVAPLVAWVLVRRLVVEPYIQQQKAKDIERHRAMHHAQSVTGFLGEKIHRS